MPGQVAVYVCVQPKMADFGGRKTFFMYPFQLQSRQETGLQQSPPTCTWVIQRRTPLMTRKRGQKTMTPCKISNLSSIWSETAAGTFIKPKRHIWVDERMVGTKARVKIKQYMKAKPTKWGAKILCVGWCEWVHSWLQPVHREDPGCYREGVLHYLYTRPLLFRHLSQPGFGACGTYKQGWAGVPAEDQWWAQSEGPCPRTHSCEWG